MKNINLRVYEKEERPKALAALKQHINSTTIFLETVRNMTDIDDPIFTEVELTTLEKLINETKVSSFVEQKTVETVSEDHPDEGPLLFEGLFFFLQPVPSYFFPSYFDINEALLRTSLFLNSFKLCHKWAYSSQCWNLLGNQLTSNLLGSTQPQSSMLTETLWTDPGLKSGNSVHKLLST